MEKKQKFYQIKKINKNKKYVQGGNWLWLLHMEQTWKYIIYTISKILNFEIIDKMQRNLQSYWNSSNVYCMQFLPVVTFCVIIIQNQNQDFDTDTMCVYNFILLYHLCRLGYHYCIQDNKLCHYQKISFLLSLYN